MRIQTKLIGIFSLAVLMVIMAIASEKLGTIKNDQHSDVSKNRYLAFVIADEFRQTSMDLTRLARTYAATGEQIYWDQYWDIVKWRNGDIARPENLNRELYAGVKKKQIDIMKELDFSDKEFELLQQASNFSNDLILTEDQAMKTVKAGQVVDGPFKPMVGESASDFALRIMFDDNYHAEVTKIMGPVTEFFNEIDNRTASNLEAVSEDANFWLNTAFILQILVGLIVVWIIFYSIKGIFTPLNKVVVAMQDIAEGEGNLNSRLEERGNDELTDLARGFNRFAENIHNLVERVSGSVEDISVSSSQLAATAESTDRAVQQQQSAMDQVAAAINEMVATVQDVANNAHHASNAVSEADAEAAQGQQVVEQAISSINRLMDEIQKASDAIAQLEQDSNTIATVLDVIRGIADQTNLLALNAAIEAARAGEQGRGFAVVADEVRTLAQRTQDSTQEIQTMIESLQNSATAVVEVMDSSRTQAQTCVEQSSQAGESLSMIGNTVTAIRDMNVQIATSSEEQSSVIEGINQNVVDMVSKVDETMVGAQQTAASSENLTNLSNDLKGLVNQFNV